MKYADLVVEWLVEEGYTHCFFVAGGNIMHLLDGVRERLTCVPVVHEVAAGVAVEYFNEASSGGRALALVTAGPGLTNLVTAVAGAYLESRELLVLGGQVKREDLASGGVRQRGIQEIDGVAILRPITVRSARVDVPMARSELLGHVRAGAAGRKGPVFLEFCLDAQGAQVEPADLAPKDPIAAPVPSSGGASAAVEETQAINGITDALASAQRPVLLLGGGISRSTAKRLESELGSFGVPVMTTWNGADRVPADFPLYFGRPNTWGQRYSNVLLQQADLVIALGTRLGLQQTGFNWQQFAPVGTVAQVDLDRAELEKGHPRVDLPFVADADVVLEGIVAASKPDVAEWVKFCQEVKELLPLEEDANVTGPGYLRPYRLLLELSELLTSEDVIVPCSSGGAFTVAMQALQQRRGQIVITDKGLASMGYGLSGAIGAAFATGRRTVLFEGDGGFTQNLQELATVSVNDLPIKTFLFSNEGYASIRMTQRNYFEGKYLGCDTGSGLGFPDWHHLFAAYRIPLLELDEHYGGSAAFEEMMASPGPAAFLVPVDPEQTYFPKIASRVTASGGMESNPLHVMSPELDESLARQVLRFV